MENLLDVDKTERKVKTIYRNVTEALTEANHFEMGRALIE